MVKIRHIVLGLAAYVTSMVIAVIVIQRLGKNQPIGELPPWYEWAIVGFYGLTWMPVLRIAGAWIGAILLQRQMGFRS